MNTATAEKNYEIKYFSPYTFANSVVAAPSLIEAREKHNAWLTGQGFMISTREIKSEKWGGKKVDFS